LLSGHHAQIAEWRRAQSLALTADKRPDLIDQARQQGLLKPHDELFLKNLN
jgi:tRNA (guanine37-N1)-methyltransferase